MVTNTNLFITPYNPYGQDYSYEALAAVIAAPYLFRGAKNLWGMANPQSNIDDQMVARQQSPSIWNQASLEYLQDPTLNIAQRVQDISNQRWDTSQAGNLWYNFLNNRGSNRLLGSQGLGLSNAEIRNLRKSARQDANQDILRNIFQANNQQDTSEGSLLNKKEWRARVAAGDTPKYTDAQGNQRGYTNYADYLKKNLWGIGLAQNYTPTQTSGGQQNTNSTQQNQEPTVSSVTVTGENRAIGNGQRAIDWVASNQTIQRAITNNVIKSYDDYIKANPGDSPVTRYMNYLVSSGNLSGVKKETDENGNITYSTTEQQGGESNTQENNIPTNDLQSVINNMTDEQRQFFTNAVMENGGQPEQNMWNLANTREQEAAQAEENRLNREAQLQQTQIATAPSWVNAQTNRAAELYGQQIIAQQVNTSDYTNAVNSISNSRIKERVSRIVPVLQNLNPEDARMLDEALRNPRNLNNPDLQSTLESIFAGANELSNPQRKEAYLSYIKSLIADRMNRSMIEPTIR